MDIKKSKKFYVVLIIMVSIIIFSLSYYISIQFFRGKNEEVDDNRIQVNNQIKEGYTQNKDNESISSNSSVVFKIRYRKSGDTLISKVDKVSNLNVKTKGELEEKFKDEYKLTDITDDKIVMVKEVDKYSPNKYVLGIKGDYIAIFRTDSNGEMYIENEEKDITDKRIDNLKEQDIVLLTNGSEYFQCNTREEALSRLEDYE
ncbi:hypothetical protein KQI86_14495 [Clostridium sp. MSJ-11]|uniref:Bypass of forespore C C-terminal domain-containing protein n=1 Tax=Clostridium mobile TaxID=2841512 RepID=A0ABS6EJZ2_9CLOT|nr:hypothetical protein [Clostridium mobile]MBU5485528.1 hypothetical protein [Clostridium mobile]